MQRTSRRLNSAVTALITVLSLSATACDSGTERTGAVDLVEPSTSTVSTAVSTVPTPVPTTSSAAPPTNVPTSPAANPAPTTPITAALTTQPESVAFGLTISEQLTPLPPQPPGVPFPTTEWPVASLAPSVDAAALDAAVTMAFGDVDGQLVRSLLIVVGGELVYERYHSPDSPDTVFNSYSIAKSFTSATVGIAAGDGLIDVAARAERPEWDDPTDARYGITVEHLLHMSSGLEWMEGLAEYQGLFASASHAAYAAERPLVAEPGTAWNYSTGTTGILTALLATELGGGPQLDAYVRERLLDPIGATSTQLMLDGTGVWRGGLGADSTARDFAKFGLLYLRDGVWDGERVLPAGWVDYSRSPSPAAGAYGAQWWLSADGDWFEARGLYGQIVRVIPSLDAIIVATSFDGGESPALVDTVHELLAAGAA